MQILVVTKQILAADKATFIQLCALIEYSLLNPHSMVTLALPYRGLSKCAPLLCLCYQCCISSYWHVGRCLHTQQIQCWPSTGPMLAKIGPVLSLLQLLASGWRLLEDCMGKMARQFPFHQYSVTCHCVDDRNNNTIWCDCWYSQQLATEFTITQTISAISASICGSISLINV